MGLKDVVERLAGKRGNGQRGSRGRGERKRERDEATMQVSAPATPWATHPESPSPAAAGPPPASSEPLRPAAAPAPAPVARPQPPAMEPAPPAPAPVSADPPPPRPASSAAGSEATQYVTVPGISGSNLVGVLVGIDGPLKDETFKIFDGDNKIGRASECDVQVLDPKVSRVHAMIASEGGVLLILPLNKQNPVYLNGEVLDEGDELSDGNTLRLGNVGASTFRFRIIEGL